MTDRKLSAVIMLKTLLKSPSLFSVSNDILFEERVYYIL